MKDASKSQQFERAIEIRDTLQRLGSINSGKKMETVRKSDEEFFGIKYNEHDAIVMTFRQTHGVIRDSEKFSFDLIGDNNFTNFLYQYYTTHEVPKTIITSEEISDKLSLQKALSDRIGFSVKIIHGNKGKRREMIELILRNISLIQNKNAEPGLVELRDILKLPSIPRVIECFDISNHGDEYAVGSMARFVNAKPNKSGYRKFKIKTVKGRDDFSMINEIVGRRYSRLKDEKKEFPDLIVIDGGKGQLSSAISALKSIGVVIPCISLAKENEEVHIPKIAKSIIIPKNKDSIKILQHARDETHRFGVAYNRKLRKLN
jgi:excinuclease ABC subunit C